jgi:lysozyme
VLLTPYEQAAFTSFVYNLGRGAFNRSTMLKLLNAGKIVAACNELPKWKYAGGVIVTGLSNRRETERQICLGIYPGVK